MGICEVSVIGHGLGRTLGRPTRSTQNCRQSHDRMLACGWAKRRFFFGKKIIAFTRGEMVEIENLKGQKAHEHRKKTSWTISQNVWKSLNQPRWWVWQRLQKILRLCGRPGRSSGGHLWAGCTLNISLTLWHGKGILFNVGGQTGKDCLLTWADGVKVADRRDRTSNLSLRKRCTNHCTTGPHGSVLSFDSGTFPHFDSGTCPRSSFLCSVTLISFVKSIMREGKKFNKHSLTSAVLVELDVSSWMLKPSSVFTIKSFFSLRPSVAWVLLAATVRTRSDFLLRE